MDIITDHELNCLVKYRSCPCCPQERATKVSHGNTARMATYYGDHTLCKMCGLIAADESRHEQAYQAIVEQFLQRCVLCAA